MFVQERCEPSGKRKELHDVYIVSTYRNTVTSCPNAGKATQILLDSNSRQLVLIFKELDI